MQDDKTALLPENSDWATAIFRPVADTPKLKVLMMK